MPAATSHREPAPRTMPLPKGAGILLTAAPGQSLADLAPRDVLELLAENGAVLFRGFSADRPMFELFTRQFASEFVLPMMRVARPKVEGAADAKTAHVDVGSHAMGLHQELSFTPVRPQAIWLWCERTAGTGGETTLADGTKLLAALTPELRRLFEAKRLKYGFGGMVSGVAELFNVKPEALSATLAQFAPDLSYRQDGDALAFTYLTSAIQACKFGGAPTFANFVHFSQTAAKCNHPEAARVMGLLRFEDDTLVPPAVVEELDALFEPLTLDIHWQSGDLVMIDNTRMMHGRRGFEANSNRSVYYRAARQLVGL